MKFSAPRQALALLGIKNASFPASFYQFTQNSDFIRALNRDDETPGDIDYTVLYTQFDELIQPAAPFPAGALEFGQNNPKRINVLLQDICPGRVVEHISIAFFDKLTLELVFDALSHDGPADVDRAGGKNLCGLPVLGSFVFAEDAATLALDAFVISNFPQGLPGLGLSPGEPPLMDYAK
jgi:triacylglycerol lipase